MVNVLTLAFYIDDDKRRYQSASLPFSRVVLIHLFLTNFQRIKLCWKKQVSVTVGLCIFFFYYIDNNSHRAISVL